MKAPLYVSCAAIAATALSLGGWPSEVAAQSPAGVAYVTSQDGDISILSLDTLSLSEAIHADGKGPRGLGVTSDGTHLVTANRDGGDVSVIDLATKKVVKHIPIGKNPEFVRVRGDQAFVSFEPSSKGGPPPKPGEKAAEDKDDDSEELLPAKIAIVDLKKLEVVGEITSGPETEGIEFTPDGKAMLVTNEADNTVTVHELPGGKLLKTVDTHSYGDRPRGVKVSPDGANYVVTLEFGDKVLVLDKNFEPVKTISTGKSPYGIAFDRSGKRLFVAASKSKELQVFDGKTFEPVKNIPVKDRCWHFSFSPDDSKIVVACGRSNNVLVFDATSYELLKDVPVKDMPWGVVTYPKAMGSLDQP
ncbi:MAG TPA: beta-propeller fold lactonase family protein [Hyphomicrobium sp.]|nr:beta-propeller fold lactonase family protein [Hyphomicrobium sp.]